MHHAKAMCNRTIRNDPCHSRCSIRLPLFWPKYTISVSVYTTLPGPTCAWSPRHIDIDPKIIHTGADFVRQSADPFTFGHATDPCNYACVSPVQISSSTPPATPFGAGSHQVARLSLVPRSSLMSPSPEICCSFLVFGFLRSRGGWQMSKDCFSKPQFGSRSRWLKQTQRANGNPWIGSYGVTPWCVICTNMVENNCSFTCPYRHGGIRRHMFTVGQSSSGRAKRTTSFPTGST